VGAFSGASPPCQGRPPQRYEECSTEAEKTPQLDFEES